MGRAEAESSVAIGPGMPSAVRHANPLARCSPESGARARGTGEIFIVGSEPVTLLDIEEMLQAERYAVVRVIPTVFQGTNSPMEHEPRLVILDVDSSLNDGVILAAKRLLEERSVPLIVLTGFANEHYQPCATVASAIHVLNKPFREQELLELVSSFLSKNHCESPPVTIEFS